jgi:hypothetical protein
MNPEQSNQGLCSGVWSFPSHVFPGHEDVMWIDEARRRIVTFVVVSVNPCRRAQVRTWYMPASATSILAGLKPLELGSMHGFRLEDDVLVLLTYCGEQAWRHLPRNEFPDWLESAVKDANAKMDRCELPESEAGR